MPEISLSNQQVIGALEASDVSAINGIICLANILRKRDIITDADATAIYESMSLPLGLPKYAENSDVQELQLNLDLLFSTLLVTK